LAVVGAGIVGASVAYHAARAGAVVRHLEITMREEAVRVVAAMDGAASSPSEL
jgi:glycine/D-amino acid oxidase-like deaminating enzyme